MTLGGTAEGGVIGADLLRDFHASWSNRNGGEIMVTVGSARLTVSVALARAVQEKLGKALDVPARAAALVGDTQRDAAFRSYMDECLIHGPFLESRVGELFAHFSAWLKAGGLEPWHLADFERGLKGSGFAVLDADGVRCRGLSIAPSPPDCARTADPDPAVTEGLAERVRRLNRTLRDPADRREAIVRAIEQCEASGGWFMYIAFIPFLPDEARAMLADIDSAADDRGGGGGGAARCLTIDRDSDPGSWARHLRDTAGMRGGGRAGGFDDEGRAG